MSLNIIDDLTTWFDKTMKNLEKLVENHFDEPLFWVLIIVVVLIIFKMALNALSK